MYCTDTCANNPVEEQACLRPHAHRRCYILASALLEICAPTIDDEDPDVDTLALELRLASLLQGVDICSVGLGGVFDTWAVHVLHYLPLSLAFILGHGVEALSHGLHDLARRRLDEQLPAVQVRQLHGEAAQGLDE